MHPMDMHGRRQLGQYIDEILARCDAILGDRLYDADYQAKARATADKVSDIIEAESGVQPGTHLYNFALGDQ